MSRSLQWIFFALFVRPIVYILIGLNVTNWQKLPKNGPAVIVANHNSHLDTLVLMSLFPLSMLHKVRPVAAADYFLSNPLIGWFATNIIGILPIHRKGEADNPLEGCFQALDKGDILILFPEGSRGEPEQGLATFKKGVQILAENRPNLRVYPVILHGLGKIFPKGAWLPLPFCCDVVIGDFLKFQITGERFLEDLVDHFNTVFRERSFPEWS